VGKQREKATFFAFVGLLGVISMFKAGINYTMRPRPPRCRHLLAAIINKEGKHIKKEDDLALD
jgi:hypothetical protein